METKVEDFKDWGDDLLFEICADTFRGLDGWLIAEERKAREADNEEAADAWEAESFALLDERRGIAVADREGQAAAILRWRARQDAVDAGSGPRIVAG